MPEDVDQRPMVVACRLEGDFARMLEGTKRRDEAVDLRLRIRHS